jgi:hypothetical protein
VHWVGTKLCDISRFDGMGLIDEFIAQMEESVSDAHKMQSMNALVKETLAC